MILWTGLFRLRIEPAPARFEGKGFYSLILRPSLENLMSGDTRLRITTVLL